MSQPWLNAQAPPLRHGLTDIETGDLIDTYARSAFEDTRKKAEKFGARLATIKAIRPAVA